MHRHVCNAYFRLRRDDVSVCALEIEVDDFNLLPLAELCHEEQRLFPIGEPVLE